MIIDRRGPPQYDCGIGDDERTRVLVCEDHPLTAQMLATIVDNDPALQLVATVDRPSDALRVAQRDGVDVVVMDIDFEGTETTGIDATAELRRAVPDVRVLILTAHLPERSLVAAVEAGAAGFARKTDAVEDISAAIRAVGRGERLIDLTALRDALPAHAERRDERTRVGSLTPREREILELLHAGATTGEVAARLVVSQHTVTTHIKNLLGKLGVSSRLEAVALARRAGQLS